MENDLKIPHEHTQTCAEELRNKQNCRWTNTRTTACRDEFTRLSLTMFSCLLPCWEMPVKAHVFLQRLLITLSPYRLVPLCSSELQIHHHAAQLSISAGMCVFPHAFTFSMPHKRSVWAGNGSWLVHISKKW
ncbi:hypothetical protein XENOCAPTIV_019651 [Xenoophorus captivus]|uniref:Uncharacterized protein n=1 Tax=Xenoophorus captivus TaxID=1517983 RepID=A0ABV0QLU2_9TELE